MALPRPVPGPLTQGVLPVVSRRGYNTLKEE